MVVRNITNCSTQRQSCFRTLVSKMHAITVRIGALTVLMLPICLGLGRVEAAQHVQFETARYLPGPLQVRQARERGEAVQRAPAQQIDGYLTKPEGDGPFPAIVLLHSCAGLSDGFKSPTVDTNAAKLFRSWGYVLLAVDSFTTRGITQTCMGEPPRLSRAADAYGAQAFLEKQSFVDPKRIVLLGFSAGGNATLAAIDAHDAPLFENEHPFKGAVAFYPYCTADRVTVPLLILVGELDDWTPAETCRRFATSQSQEGGGPVKLVVYPGTYHAFDIQVLQPGRMMYGHWLEYNPVAAKQAVQDVREFLSTLVGQP